MEQTATIESKKRSLRDVMATDLAFKFKSKQDFIIFLD